MSKRKDLVCICCPMGCRLAVDMSGGAAVSIQGYSCPKGRKYAETECTHPSRTVTSTVPVDSGESPMLSVKTSGDIPKEKIFACMAQLRGLHVRAPVKAGHVVLKNVAGTGVDIVATKSVGSKTA